MVWISRGSVNVSFRTTGQVTKFYVVDRPVRNETGDKGGGPTLDYIGQAHLLEPLHLVLAVAGAIPRLPEKDSKAWKKLTASEQRRLGVKWKNPSGLIKLMIELHLIDW